MSIIGRFLNKHAKDFRLDLKDYQISTNFDLQWIMKETNDEEFGRCNQTRAVNGLLVEYKLYGSWCNALSIVVREVLVTLLNNLFRHVAQLRNRGFVAHWLYSCSNAMRQLLPMHRLELKTTLIAQRETIIAKDEPIFIVRNHRHSRLKYKPASRLFSLQKLKGHLSVLKCLQ